MKKIKTSGEYTHRLLIGLLVIGLLGCMLLLSAMFRSQTSAMSDEDESESLQVLRVNSYIFNANGF